MKNTGFIKKCFAGMLLGIVLLTALLPVCAQAAEVLWDSYEVPSTRLKPRLYDDADLLTSDQERVLLSKLDSISEKHSCNVVVLTVNSHTGPIEAYADDYFDYNGFCADYNEAGILFMLSMADREYAISTSGSGIQAFTDYGQEYITNNLMDYLRNGDYYNAFNSFADDCDSLLDMYESGTPYDVGYRAPRTASDYMDMVLLSLGIGLIVGLIPIFVMKSQLHTVKMNTGARNYASHHGLSMSCNSDTFITSRISKVPIPRDTGSSSGSHSRSSFGGGSSVHTSSSGHSHGGSHGHF